jgi:hypothetical protein
MQEDGRLVRPADKMAYPDFLKWIQKKLAQGWQICGVKMDIDLRHGARQRKIQMPIEAVENRR